MKAHVAYHSCFYWSGLLLAVILFSSCEQELKLPEIKGSNKIVLLGEMTAGDSVLIRAGQSAPLAANTPALIELPEELQMVLTEPHGSDLALTGAPDFNTEVLRTIPFFNAHVIGHGGTYKIRASHAGLGTVNCSVYIPGPFVASVTDTMRTIYAGANVMQFDVLINDRADEQNYYAVEVMKQGMYINALFFYDNNWMDVSWNKTLYDSLKNAGVVLAMQYDTSFADTYSRISVYTNDAFAENLKFGSSLSGYRRILLDDRSFNGGAHSLRFFADRSFFTSLDDQDKGRVILKVKSIPGDYFRFLKGYEQVEQNDALDNVSLPLQLEGNVVNGSGVVGGVYLQERHFIFDKWNF